MPNLGLIALALFVLFVVYMVVQAKRAGPKTLSDHELRRARVVERATRDDPGAGWQEPGAATTVNGLDLKFDHDDDPKAEASFFVGNHGERRRRGTLALPLTVRLKADFETHHVHTRGWIFRVRLRGTGGVVGKEVRLGMHVTGNGVPHCGRVENDDDTDAAVGDWIEFESVEVLQVAS